jgi:GNAT superfamily N-acetyltransferase
MIEIRYASVGDERYWFELDKHLSKKEYSNKVLQNQCYIIEEDKKCFGIIRYNLFWDLIPFLNLIYIDPGFHKRGIGRAAMLLWESEMRKLDHKLVMTSTMVEESSQHFYRKLGYKDCGCLIKDFEPFAETMEMFMMKPL